jgi:protein-arginine kinase activator protein McsA
MPINYADYPANWLSEIVPAIRLRSGNKCEECGIPNGTIIQKGKRTPATDEQLQRFADLKAAGNTHQRALKKADLTQIVLTTAHLDHDKENENVSLERLRHWCQKCHLSYDSSRHQNNRRYGYKYRESQLTLEL